MTHIPYTTDIAAANAARFSYVDSQLARLRAGIKTSITNILDYGVAGDGVSIDRIGIQAAIGDIAKAGGGEIFFPPGTYLLNGNGNQSLDINASNITITGVPGLTWFKHAAGMPNQITAIARVNLQSNVALWGIGFDGNWGNYVVAVERTSNNATLPTATINVKLPPGYTSLAAMGWPTSGTFTLADDNGGQTITYTGIGTSSFTGCGGGTGTLHTNQRIGRQDSQGGINHATQPTPQNYGLLIRGCENVWVENCLFRQIYGDAIWAGHDANNLIHPTKNLHIVGCRSDVAARNGMTVTGRVEDIYVQRSQFYSSFTSAFDTEDCIAHKIHIDRCILDSWFNPASHPGVNPLSIVGGQTAQPGPAAWSQHYRVSNTDIFGSVVVESVADVRFSDCNFFTNYTAVSGAPAYVQFVTERVVFDNCNFYDRGGSSGTSHEGAITIMGGNSGQNQVAEVIIRGGNIWAQAGRYGISVHGPGGRLGDAGTASGVTATTLTDGTKAWTVNQFACQPVRMGNVVGEILSNTSTTLTIDQWTVDLGAPDGDPFPTPALGAYEILANGLFCRVEGVNIDCSNRGWGNGASGIWLTSDNTRSRFRVTDCIIRNANGPAIKIQPPGGAPNLWLDLQLLDNTAMDDQVTPTCTATLGFQSANLNQITRTTMRNNQAIDGVPAAMTGLTSGRWLVSSGLREEWAGFGAPSFAAPKGSFYTRVDGGAGTTLYVNESGSTTWAAK